MMQTQMKTKEQVWLKLPGYRVAALKSEFSEHAIQLKRAIHEGVLGYPDPARADFYDVALEWGMAYIHVHREGRAVYLVAHKSTSAYLTVGTVYDRASLLEVIGKG